MRTNYFNHLLHKELGHFTVIDGNKTGVDLVLIKHFLFSYGNLVDLILTSILQALCRILFFFFNEGGVYQNRVNCNFRSHSLNGMTRPKRE